MEPEVAPVGQSASGTLTPAAPYSPEQYDVALVSQARAEALQAITNAGSRLNGAQAAWSATVSFAEALMPMASHDFLSRYRALTKLARQSKQRPSRALWRICSLEMKRQGRLGKEPVPVAREKFGIPK